MARNTRARALAWPSSKSAWNAWAAAWAWNQLPGKAAAFGLNSGKRDLFGSDFLRPGRDRSLLAEDDVVQGKASRPGEQEQERDTKIDARQFVGPPAFRGHERVVAHDGVRPDRHRHGANDP